MTTIVEPDTGRAAALESTLGRALTLGSVDEVMGHLETRPDEYAVVLGPGISMAAAVTLADTLRVTRPLLSVVLVRDEVDTEVLAEALRSGMREVCASTDPVGLDQAVRRAYSLYEALNEQVNGTPKRRRGTVITVFSAKGGVGKTTVATNLAVLLSDNGVRQVCLVDLDLAFGDVAITLQIFPTRTIADAVPMQHDLDMAGLESLLTPVRDGIQTLVAPVQPDAKDSITPALIGSILELLRERFEYVVIDTPPAFDDQVLQAFDVSDQILLVATPDIPALKNLKVAQETLTLLNIPRTHIHLVLNRAQPKVGVTAEEVSASLGMPIVAMVPSSADVPASINRGEPIVVTDPKHPCSRGLAALADVVTAGRTHAEPTVDEPAGDSARKRSRFGRKARA